MHIQIHACMHTYIHMHIYDVVPTVVGFSCDSSSLLTNNWQLFLTVRKGKWGEPHIYMYIRIHTWWNRCTNIYTFQQQHQQQQR